MIKKLSLLVLTLTLFSSCVSKKIYTDLNDKYTNLKKENRLLSDTNEDLNSQLVKANNSLQDMQDAYDTAVANKNLWEADYKALVREHKNLEDSYKALEQNSSTEIAKNAKKNRELLAQLEAKEQALTAENARLEKLKNELENRSNRVAQLESVIAAKDANMRALKEAISKALTNFEGKGLTVEQRNGKVYVSMENKLLFKSGSWSVGTEGKKAVQQLGTVLAENTDIAVLIEGHTDDDPYKGNEHLSGNWDLSAKRATAIVNILRENTSIDPKNLTAAGRGEHAPIASNETASGKAKNRRIEVILTPKLDLISKLLDDM